MSFQEPLFLLLLLLVPAAVGLYLLGERGRGRAAERFASPKLTAAVAPRRPGFRRHAPMLLYALALAALTLALARPEATVAVPERARRGGAGDRHLRLDAATRRGADAHAGRAHGRARLPRPRRRSDLRVGTVVFNHAGPPHRTSDDRPRAGARGHRATARPAAAPPPARRSPPRWRCSSAPAARRAGAPPRRGDPALRRRLDPWTRPDPARAARPAAAKVPVYTVALGTDAGTIEVPDRNGVLQQRSVPPDRATMREIARITRGKTFNASDGDEVSRGLQAPRLAGGHERRAAPGHRRVRRRRRAAAAGGRPDVAALVRPSALSRSRFP